MPSTEADLVAEEILHRLRAALVHHALDVHARDLLEELAREVLRRAGAGIAPVELAGFFFARRRHPSASCTATARSRR
jgi:hypothetical protein